MSHLLAPLLRCCCVKAMVVMAVVGIWCSSNPAVLGQITAQAILEPFVEKYGPQYQDVERAIDSLKEQKLEDAKKFLQTAYDKNPDLPPPDIMLAQILFSANQIEPARQSLEEATRKTPEDPAAYVYLGELALQQRRLVEAESMYKTGIEKCEKYKANNKRKGRLLANAYGGLALMEESKENWAAARKLLENLLKYDKDNSLAMTRLGRVVFKMAKDRAGESEAFKIFQQLREKDANSALAEVNMALLYEQDGRRPNAARLMEEAIKKDGNSVATRLAVAKWAMDTGNLELAEANSAAAAKIEPNSFNVLLFKGLVARFKNDLAGAEAAFKEAHLKSPKHLGAMTQLVLTLIESPEEDKQRQAVEFAEVCVRVYSDLNQPGGREAAVVYGWCLSKLKRPDEAFQTIRQVVGKGSISADSAFFAAQILYDAGQTTAAQKMLETALEGERSFPNKKAAQDLLARINK